MALALAALFNAFIIRLSPTSATLGERLRELGERLRKPPGERLREPLGERLRGRLCGRLGEPS